LASHGDTEAGVADTRALLKEEAVWLAAVCSEGVVEEYQIGRFGEWAWTIGGSNAGPEPRRWREAFRS